MKPLTTFLVFILIVFVGIGIYLQIRPKDGPSGGTGGTVGATVPPSVTGPSGKQTQTPPPPTQTPGSNDIIISIASSNTKENWIEAVIKLFNQERHKIVSGETIFVRATHVTSGGSQAAILAGELEPIVESRRYKLGVRGRWDMAP